jgi:hypothetical protein
MALRGALSTTVDDRTWRALRAHVGTLSRATLKVGITTSARHSKGDISLADLLATHEFGAPLAGIPARRPLRSAFAAKRDAFAKVIRAAVAAATRQRNPISALEMMDRIGRWAADMVRTYIKSTNLAPPLKPATIKRKGHAHALIDSGEMVDNIGYAVEER